MSYVLLLQKKSKARGKFKKTLHSFSQKQTSKIPQKQNMSEANQLLIKTSPKRFEGIVTAQILL